MIKLFVEGGVIMMSLLTLVLLAMVVFTVSRRKAENADQKRPFQRTIQILARIALALGALSFLLGMYSGFSIMENMEFVSTEILSAGIRVASISLCYGLIIYLIGQIIILVNQRMRS